jgi:hypothetical protein
MSNSVKPSTKKQEILALRISVRIFLKKTAPALTSTTPPDIYLYTKRKSHDLHYILVPAFSLLCSTASVLFSAAVWMAWQGEGVRPTLTLPGREGVRTGTAPSLPGRVRVGQNG